MQFLPHRKLLHLHYKCQLVNVENNHYCVNHTKHINTLYGYSSELLMLKHMVHRLQGLLCPKGLKAISLFCPQSIMNEARIEIQWNGNPKYIMQSYVTNGMKWCRSWQY